MSILTFAKNKVITPIYFTNQFTIFMFFSTIKTRKFYFHHITSIV
ncbi:Uncharacterised protein [Mycobacteroides abscessus subsp. abscessus]|nr:Uncharacterised protein [Mycobacteroides abscessus subsp. abscessus]